MREEGQEGILLSYWAKEKCTLSSAAYWIAVFLYVNQGPKLMWFLGTLDSHWIKGRIRAPEKLFALRPIIKSTELSQVWRPILSSDIALSPHFLSSVDVRNVYKQGWKDCWVAVSRPMMPQIEASLRQPSSWVHNKVTLQQNSNSSNQRKYINNIPKRQQYENKDKPQRSRPAWPYYLTSPP